MTRPLPKALNPPLTNGANAMPHKLDPFFDGLKSWSKRKHRLLEKYLLPFVAKVGSRSREIYCVDGFAGAAKYGDAYEGSPLVMAHAADKCANWSNPRTLRIINVESKRRHYDALCEATRSWEDRGIVINKRGAFGKLMPEIMDIVKNTPAFFFIDPYGPTKIFFSYLKPILERNQPITELIINFDADGLRRLGDDLRANTKSEISQKACQTIVTRVSNILGNEDWKPYFATDQLPPAERELYLVRNYVKSLTKYGYKVVAYPIRESLKSSPKYYLIYCTRHSDGVILMNRFMREEEDDLISQAAAAQVQASFFNDESLESKISARRIELQELIIEYMKNVESSTRGKIKSHFIFKRFAAFHDKDFTAVVQELINTDILRPGHGRLKVNDEEPLTYVSQKDRRS